MMLVELQAAPGGDETPLATTCGCPPEMRTRFRLASAKNPIHWLSGDENCMLAPPVPVIGSEVSESHVPSHNCFVFFPSSLTATETKWRPSGEMANGRS